MSYRTAVISAGFLYAVMIKVTVGRWWPRTK